MILWPKSDVLPNMQGQPPSITVMPCCRPYSVAVSETLHQLSWVVGGLAGLAVSFTNSGPAGLAVAAAGLGVALFLLLARRRRRIRAGRRAAPRPQPAPWPR